MLIQFETERWELIESNEMKYQIRDARKNSNDREHFSEKYSRDGTHVKKNMKSIFSAIKLIKSKSNMTAEIESETYKAPLETRETGEISKAKWP